MITKQVSQKTSLLILLASMAMAPQLLGSYAPDPRNHTNDDWARFLDLEQELPTPSTRVRNDAMETGVAALLGLLLSAELKKSTDPQETASRNLRRIVYIPALLFGNAVLNTFIPQRSWNIRTVGCWTMGLSLGLIIPHKRLFDSPEQSRSENVEGTHV